MNLKFWLKNFFLFSTKFFFLKEIFFWNRWRINVSFFCLLGFLFSFIWYSLILIHDRLSTLSSSKPELLSNSRLNTRSVQSPMTTSAVVNTLSSPNTWPPITLPFLSDSEMCKWWPPIEDNVPTSDTISMCSRIVFT